MFDLKPSQISLRRRRSIELNFCQIPPLGPCTVYDDEIISLKFQTDSAGLTNQHLLRSQCTSRFTVVATLIARRALTV